MPVVQIDMYDIIGNIIDKSTFIQEYSDISTNNNHPTRTAETKNL